MTGAQALIGRDPSSRRSTHSRAIGMAGLSTGAELFGLDDRTMEFIRWKALRLGGRGVFTGYDAQDLKQEMFLECWKKSALFNPSKSCRRTFLQRVVNNWIGSFIEERTAGCRDYRLCQRSLDEPVPFTRSGTREFGETISAADYEMRVGRSHLSGHECAELQIDIARVITTLPTELAAVALLLKSVSAVDAGRRLGLSRSTLYRRLVTIREIFVAAGLDKYLRSKKGRSLTPLCRGACASPANSRPQDHEHEPVEGHSRLKSKDSSPDAI